MVFFITILILTFIYVICYFIQTILVLVFILIFLVKLTYFGYINSSSWDKAFLLMLLLIILVAVFFFLAKHLQIALSYLNIKSYQWFQTLALMFFWLWVLCNSLNLRLGRNYIYWLAILVIVLISIAADINLYLSLGFNSSDFFNQSVPII